jgi:RNA-dependent RNA polymerase
MYFQWLACYCRKESRYIQLDWMGKTIQLSGFPSSVTAAEVKAYLEQRTGAGTVYAIKVRNTTGGPRAYAIIQFTTTSEAEYIISLANQRLYYGRSYLKARQMEHDIVPRPRTFLHNIENITLHFGCQISDEKFLILWKAENVSVKFGSGMRKLHFSLSHNYVDYRLELFYENVWQIELHRPRNQTAKYLLIQVAHSTLD